MRASHLELEIEQLRTANEAMREALSRLEYAQSLQADLCDAATVGMLAVSPDRVIRAANRRASELLETAGLDLVGLIFDTLLHSESLHVFRAHLPAAPTMQANTALVVLIGGRRVKLSTSSRRDSEFSLMHLMCLEDITQETRVEEALGQSELRLRAILSATAEAIVTLDHDRRIESVNAAAEELFGFAPHEAVGMAISDLLPALGANQPGETWRRYMSGRSRDGSTCEVLVSSCMVPAAGEQLEVLTMQDVTEWRRLQKETLLVAEREQRRLGRDLHDGISQQLAGVGYMGRVVQRRLAQRNAPEAGDMLRIINLVKETQDHVRRLTRTLYPAEVERYGLRSALAVLAESVSSMSHVSCRFRRDGDGEVTDEQSDINLFRIAQEASSNAVRHGQARNIDIELLWWPHEIVLRITDDGRGFQPEEPYSGLGLRIMRERAHFVGGRLEVNSALGEGTCVTVRITR